MQSEELSPFGNLLKQHRSAAHLTQEELAERAKLNKNTIYLLECGDRHPRLTTIQMLADALNLPDKDRAFFEASARKSARSRVNVSSPSTPQERLTWSDLCQLCQDITERRTRTMRRKFQQDLYLPRAKTQQALAHFLQSEKRCFVLIGTSGVGKTSFLLDATDNLTHSRNGLCVLMFDGGALSVEPSITSFISEDIEDRFQLPGRQIEDIWREIAQIDGINERTVLLVVDALNENPQAQELLRQLDRLVQRPWPWLKIVFSCRPETWREIKRRVRLDEAFYYQPDEPTTEAGWGSASLSERMDPFSDDELPHAYARYQTKFSLQTNYERIAFTVRDLLREPLQLLLVARAYKDQAIPPNLKTTQLVELYVERLVESRRLEWEDIHFLESQLVPLMVREGYYTEAITRADIRAASERLQLAIMSEEPQSDGRQMHQSLLNLVNAEILVRQDGLRGQQRITFTHERFYEYFAGERIFELTTTTSDPAAFFLELITQTAHQPFLWGAVSHALLQKAREGSEIIPGLCFTDQPRVKDMLVDVLATFGLEQREQAKEWLDPLIPPAPKATAIQRIRGLLGKTERTLDKPSQNACKIAVEVASRLTIPQMLQRAALQADPTIRTAAVRFGYHLWQRDQEAGFAILEYLARQATAGVIPDPTAIEALFGLSVIIVFAQYQDKATLSRLQRIWRPLLAKLLLLQENERRLGSVVRAFVRERLFSLFITVGLRLLRELPDYNAISYEGLEAFFRLGTREKTLYRKLVHYLDRKGNYAREDMEQDLLQVLEVNNLLFGLLTVMALVAHLGPAPLAFLPFVQTLFNEAKSDVTRYPYLTEITNAVENALVLHPEMDALFDVFLEMVEVCQDCYTRQSKALRNRLSEAPGAMYLGPYILHRYRRARIVKTDLLETRIKEALATKHIRFFEILLTAELPLVGIERQQPAAALEAVRLFFETPDPDIQRFLVAFLARLRVRYPDEVDGFLEERKASGAFRLRVQTEEPLERVGELIGEKSWCYLRDAVILDSPTLRQHLIWIFEQAAECRNLRAWVGHLLREVINVVYGAEVLAHSDSARR